MIDTVLALALALTAACSDDTTDPGAATDSLSNDASGALSDTELEDATSSQADADSAEDIASVDSVEGQDAVADTSSADAAAKDSKQADAVEPDTAEPDAGGTKVDATGDTGPVKDVGPTCKAADCDDGNPCTSDGCTDNACSHDNLVDTECDDGSACTVGDMCKDGACLPGATTPCNAGNTCTADGCGAKTGCTHNKLSGPSCSEGDVCTVADACKDGVCLAGALTVCDDEEVCTKDSCKPASGCDFAALTGPKCSDDNACTLNDLCGDGACLPGKATVCNDDNICTDDSCNTKTGDCIFAANTAPCDDNNACTVADQCAAKGCVPGPAKNCDDSDPCTADGCHPGTACHHTPLALGDACDEDKICVSGICKFPYAASVSTRQEHSCAIHGDGTASCWGANDKWQLGTGDAKEHSIPTKVVAVTGAQKVLAGGWHNCARMKTGHVRCWGWNKYGQLGNGLTKSSKVGVQVTGLDNVVHLAVGFSHNCAVKKDGQLVCWGYNNNGQLGTGKTSYVSPTPLPVLVKGIGKSKTVWAGDSHTCAVGTDDLLRCWGKNNGGQVGTGKKAEYPFSHVTPVVPKGLGKVKLVQLGGEHSCVVTMAGKTLCFGINTYGQIGNGTKELALQPVPVKNLAEITSLSAGIFHNCAILKNKSPVCWGFNGTGQLGNGFKGVDADALVPVAVKEIGPVVEVAAGKNHSCARKIDGDVMCWGSNTYGELGNGSHLSTTKPVAVKVVKP